MNPVWLACACGAFLGGTLGVVVMGALVLGKLREVAVEQYWRGRRAGVASMGQHSRRWN